MFFEVNEFLIQRQLILSSLVITDGPLKYIRHISLDTDQYLLRNISRNPQDLVELLQTLPISFPAIRTFSIRTDEVSPANPYIHKLYAQCHAETPDLVSATDFTAAGRFVAHIRAGRGFQLIVTQGPEAELFNYYNSLPSNDPLMRASESLTRQTSAQDLHDAIRWATWVERWYDASHADTVAMVELYLPYGRWPSDASGWQTWSMFIWDLGPPWQKLPEWTRARG